jgi:hypothetical protein
MMAQEYLREAAFDIGSSADRDRFEGPEDIEWVRTREGLGTHHVQFRQTYQGVPVYGSEIVVSLHDARGVVTALTSEYKPGIELATNVPALAPDAAEQFAVAHLSPDGTVSFGPFSELVVHSSEGAHRLAYRVTFVLADPRGDWEVFVDAHTGELFSVRDRMAYAEADGSGLVFHPDPITTGEVPYGTPGYVDNGDSTSPELDSERICLPLFDIWHLPSGDYRLTGRYTAIFDFPGADGAPFVDTPPASGFDRADPDSFNWTRDELGFEAATVYAHITLVQHWLQVLGFDDVNNMLDPADPHGLAGWPNPDNSMYSPTVDAFAFGQGGVDDGEDAGVIAHEYGHAIQEAQVPGWGRFHEGAAMGEGFGDYLAGSYAASIGTYLENWVMKWDGPFWSGMPGGRRLDSAKSYPDSLVFEPHDDGEIWSACLWEIRGILGRKKTDTIVVQSHFYLTPGATFRDGALALIQADQDVYGGANEMLIRGIFEARGILTPTPFRIAEEIWSAPDLLQPAVSFGRSPKLAPDEPLMGRYLLTTWTDDGLDVNSFAQRAHASGGPAGDIVNLGAIYDPDVAFAPLQPVEPVAPQRPSFLVVGAMMHEDP